MAVFAEASPLLAEMLSNECSKLVIIIVAAVVEFIVCRKAIQPRCSHRTQYFGLPEQQ